MLVVMIVVVMIVTLVFLGSSLSLQQSRLAVTESNYLQLANDAEFGMGIKFDELAKASEQIGGDLALTAQVPIAVTAPSGNTITVTAFDEGNGIFRIVATAQTPGAQQAVDVETHISAAVPEVFRKALYVGNKDGLPVPVRLGPTDNLTSTFTYDENQFRSSTYRLTEAQLGVDLNGDGDLSDNPRIRDVNNSGSYSGWGTNYNNMVRQGNYYGQYKIDLDQDGTYGTYTKTVVNAPEFAAPTGTEAPVNDWYLDHQGDGDYVNGDVHVNGDAELRGNTLAFEKVEATGTVTGQNVRNDQSGGATPIAPPNLQKEYNPDTTITPSTVNSHPAFFSQNTSTNFYGQLGTGSSGQDNGVVHLGPSGSGASATFPSSDSGKLFMVKGNLWLHSATSKEIELPTSHGIVITIVVEGNMYIGDDFRYNHPDSAVLFLVKGKADDPNTPQREDESYYDANKNFTYDPGEAIINDDGNGVYDGPREGQGNVYFGDAKSGTGGVTDGFMYAENNAYLMDPNTATAPLSNFNEKDKIYGVYGFLSAGGVVDLGERTLGDDTYFQYKVTYDDRLERRVVNFKGLPQEMSGGGNFALLSWTTRRR